MEVHRLGHAGVDLDVARLLTLFVHTQLVPIYGAGQGDHLGPVGNQAQSR